MVLQHRLVPRSNFTPFNSLRNGIRLGPKTENEEKSSFDGFCIESKCRQTKSIRLRVSRFRKHHNQNL